MRRRKFAQFALALVVAWAAVTSVLYVSQRHLVFPGAVAGPGDMSWGVPEVVVTADGETLHALYERPAEGGTVVLFFHGNTDRVGNYGFLARRLAEEGHGFFAVSYRGYPGSTGRPSEAGLFKDGLAAFDRVAREHSGPVVVMGQSLGTGVAVHVAAERDVDGVVLLSPYDSIAAVAAGILPFVPVGALMSDPFRSDLTISRVKQPKLFLHGDRDTVVPLARGRALYEVSAQPKRLKVVEGHGHNDMWRPVTVEAITDFIRAVSQPRGMPEA